MSQSRSLEHDVTKNKGLQFILKENAQSFTVVPLSFISKILQNIHENRKPYFPVKSLKFSGNLF